MQNIRTAPCGRQAVVCATRLSLQRDVASITVTVPVPASVQGHRGTTPLPPVIGLLVHPAGTASCIMCISNGTTEQYTCKTWKRREIPTYITRHKFKHRDIGWFRYDTQGMLNINTLKYKGIVCDINNTFAYSQRLLLYVNTVHDFSVAVFVLFRNCFSFDKVFLILE